MHLPVEPPLRVPRRLLAAQIEEKDEASILADIRDRNYYGERRFDTTDGPASRMQLRPQLTFQNLMPFCVPVWRRIQSRPLPGPVSPAAAGQCVERHYQDLGSL